MTKSEKITQINAKLTADIAAVKARKEQTIADYYAQVAELQRAACEAKNAAQDDDEPQEEQEQKQKQKQEQQPVVWLDGSQYSAVITARRILNKLPKLNSPKESFYIEISPSYFGGCGLSFRYINTIDKSSGVTSCELLPRQEPEEQSQKIDLWMKEVEVQMANVQEIMREEAENE